MKKNYKFLLPAYIILLFLNWLLVTFFQKLDYVTYRLYGPMTWAGMLFLLPEMSKFRANSELILPDSDSGIFQNSVHQVKMIRTLERVISSVNLFFAFFPTAFFGILIVLFTLNLNSDIATFLLMIVALVLGFLQLICRLRLLKILEDSDVQPRKEYIDENDLVSQKTMYALDFTIIIMICLEIFLYINHHMDLFDDDKYGIGLLNGLLLLIFISFKVMAMIKSQKNQNT